ncbi:MAG: DNA circularization N-terminal domain-containing protein [Gallionella sp.]|nr:DNA circularization N-terminal domain-containing protein [Gallionella sp.]MDD4947447.1 DNA circularization N-terminal domain-containing protein [Gallionella sp.]
MIPIADQPGWALRMVTASFRGNQFLTESHDMKGGRRLVAHEFPGGEQSVVKDLGGKAGEFRLAAYFIGPDYDLFRDAFLLALNTPGADWLDHPWRGKLWVRARDWSVHESNDQGGYCTISVDFVPGGTDTALPSADLVDIAVGSIKHWQAVVEEDFKPQPMSALSMTSMIAMVSAQLDQVRNLLALATLPLTWMNQVRGVMDGIKGDAAALLALPATYAAALRGLSDTLGAGDGSVLADTARPQVVASLVAAAVLPAMPPAGAGDSPALRINLQQDAALRGRLLLASAAQLALTDYRVAADRNAALASVVGAIDAMLPAMPDAVFQAALDLRAALIAALRAQQLAPAVVRDIVQPLPATVLAHRMEVAEDVFMAANKVRHPLFVRGRVYG